MYNYISDLMVEIVVTARKWGNSIGATFPAQAVELEKIKPNDKIILEVKKVISIKDLFGTLKTKKTAQQLKDDARNGWE